MSAFHPLQTLGSTVQNASMKHIVVVSLGLISTLVAGTAFALSTPRTQEVAGKHFAVPGELLLKDTIPWLPATEAGSFTFLLNPNLSPEQTPPHRVLVQSAKEVCRGDRMTQVVRVACGREGASRTLGPPFEKVFPHAGYPYTWHYYAAAAAGGDAERLQVAYCSPISPNPARPTGTAICTTVWGVDGLVLSLGFEEHELAELPSMRRRASEMLLSWKVR